MSELIVSRQQQVLLLTLNRPAARNALNNALLTQLVNELEAAATDTSISVCVITGNARFFAAGADLNEMAEKDLAATFNDTRPQLWARLQAFNKPLIAAVNGYALGAGCELALLCDVVVAGENARFGLPEITLGIMPGAGGTQRLIRSVGKSLASKMVLSGESITAQQAQQAGLVSDVFPSDLTLEYALQLASKMARHSPLALQAAKQALRQSQEVALQAGLAQERQLFTLLAATEDRHEGISAFLQNARPTLRTLMMELILSHVEKGVMTLTLNRPERLNSFNDEMHAQLAECLKQAERDDTIRCLLITGAGRGFCAGQDLNDRNVDPTGPAPDLGMSVERFYNPLVRCLAKLPKPVICAVNGVAAGAGATLALGCDIVIAARSAKFVMAFSKLGLVPDCGGTWLLPRVAGRARALGLALLGNQLSAEQAHEWGMIWQVVDDETLADTAQQLARHLATQPTFGLGLIKQAINSAETNTLDTQLDLERDYQRLAGRSADYREGVSAFLAKRSPQFTGK